MSAPLFRDNRDLYDKIVKEVELLDKSYVAIGFQKGSTTKFQLKGNRIKKAGLSMPQIAAANEFGTNKIPARPFMSTSFDENKKKISNAIEGEYDRILEGSSTVKRSLGLIGLLMEGYIQDKIRQIQHPPNAPSTIRIKKSSKPLIDFGQMIASVVSKVVLK